MTITRTGAQLGIVAAVLAGCGIAAGYPELVLIAAAGVAGLAVGLAWALLVRVRLTLSRSFEPAEPRAGQTVTVTMLAANLDSRPSPEMRATEKVGAHSRWVDIPSLAVREQSQVAYQIPTVRRGRLAIEQARLSRYDPLGLVRTSVPVGQRDEICVYPDWHPGIGSLRANGLDPGPVETVGPPQGDVVFHSLREYRAGDPPRMIHWRATAKRGGAPVVWQSADPEEPAQILLLDTAEAEYSNDGFEQAVRIIASLAMAAGREGLGLELHTTGDGLLLAAEPPDAPANVGRSALDLLCDVTQSQSAERIADLVERLPDSSTSHRSAVLGVVAGRSAEAAASALTRAWHRFEAVYLIRVGAVQNLTPADGVIRIAVPTCEDLAVRFGAER
jgi:uncharacterized protein (DUF58 family)